MANRPFETKKDFVADLIRAKVISGEFEPGQRIRQDDLASELDISSTPVREAMRQLVAEGILADIPHRGVWVPSFKPDQTKGVYQIRIALEGLATELASERISAKDLGRLNTLNSKLLNAMKGGEQELANQLNQQFHYTIYDQCDIPLLCDMIDMIWPRFPWRAIFEGSSHRLDEIVLEHEDIIAALREQNSKVARQALEYHIEAGAQPLLSHYADATLAQGEKIN